MKQSSIYIMALVSLLYIESVFAGPGGIIVSTITDTFIGKLILLILIIVFFPFVVYMLVMEKIAERRARKDLRYMAKYDSVFDWLQVQQRAKDCFFRVHSGWESEDLSSVSNWMTDWYWQNQQSIHLNRWKREGLINICVVKKIISIKPLLFVHRNQELAHEDSMIMISIEAKMKDYLKDRQSGKVVEGSKRFKDVETIWTLTMENGVWKVSDIEEGSMSLSYAKLTNEIPPIESTVKNNFNA